MNMAVQEELLKPEAVLICRRCPNEVRYKKKSARNGLCLSCDSSYYYYRGHLRRTDPSAPILTVEEFIRKHPPKHLRRRESSMAKRLPMSQIIPGFVFAGNAMGKVANLIEKAAKHVHVPVLIVGETGTGKELVAQAIHQLSPRANGPFVTVDCTTLNRELFESDLFGYERGSFTGAGAAREGLLLASDSGTVFIDEISKLSLDMQSKFLRFVQEKSFRPVGSRKYESVDVRIVAATNQSLSALVAKGSFQEDLYYRLNVVLIRVPPLRERRDEIRSLAMWLLMKLSGDVQQITDEATRALQRHSWPGNVRELHNVLQRALVMRDNDNAPITREDLGDLSG